jgi:type I restriction enzyme, S subunit
MSNLPDTLPRFWTIAPLGDVCSPPQYGFTTKASRTGGLKLLRTTDISSGEVDWSTVPYCSTDPEDAAKYLLDDGDIVISRAGSVGLSYLLRNPEKAVFASYLIRFRPYILDRYLAYYLQSPFYWDAISEKKLGIAIPNVNANTLRNIVVPIPPEPEQERIVDKIEKLFSALDKGVEALETACQQLTAYRQAILKSAFEGRLTADLRSAMPPWRETNVGDEIEFLTSGSRGWSNYYADEGELFIRAQNLKYDRLELVDVAFVKLPPNNAEGVRTRVSKGDVLITITGANVAKTGFVQTDIGPAYVSQHVALCRPSASLVPEFLYWHLLSEAHGRRQLNDAAYGAGKPGLNLENIRNVTLSLPSPEEQAVVIERINLALSLEERLLSTVESELERSKILRQSILKSAFSGQLVPQNPGDESALTLLKRIKAEKENALVGKKNRHRKEAA